MEDLKERFLASEGRLLALVADRGDDALESQARANRLSRALRVGQVDLAVTEFEAMVDLAERGSADLPKILQTLTWAQNQIGNSLFSEAETEAGAAEPDAPETEDADADAADDGEFAEEPELEPELVPANGYQG